MKTKGIMGPLTHLSVGGIWRGLWRHVDLSMGWRDPKRGAFANAKPLFDIMDKRPCIAGDAGAGSGPRKSANNMILGLQLIATWQGLRWPDKLGLDRQKNVLTVVQPRSSRGIAGQ